MRALVWITETTWEACVLAARTLVPASAELTLLYVTSAEAEEIASGASAGLLGRRPRRHPEPELRAASEAEAQALLQSAAERLGRPAERRAVRGRVEHVLVQESARADVLVLGRDGRPRHGPASIGPRTRFVLDHAACAVLLVNASGGKLSPPPPLPF